MPHLQVTVNLAASTPSQKIAKGCWERKKIIQFQVSATRCGHLLYKPNHKISEATIKIDDCDVAASVHPITNRKSVGKTPRHIVSGELACKLHSPIIIHTSSKEHVTKLMLKDTDQLITPKIFSAYEGVEAMFPNGMKTAVLYGTCKSKNQYLRNLHSLYKDLQTRLDNLFHSIKTTEFCVDDLAGGLYLPFGLG